MESKLKCGDCPYKRDCEEATRNYCRVVGYANDEKDKQRFAIAEGKAYNEDSA